MKIITKEKFEYKEVYHIKIKLKIQFIANQTIIQLIKKVHSLMICNKSSQIVLINIKSLKTIFKSKILENKKNQSATTSLRFNFLNKNKKKKMSFWYKQR